MHNEWVELGGFAISLGIGLLLGRWLWALRLAFLAHNPTCPAKQDVLDEARRVQIDIDDLTRGSRA